VEEHSDRLLISLQVKEGLPVNDSTGSPSSRRHYLGGILFAVDNLLRVGNLDFLRVRQLQATGSAQ
jgi:hypothetical protein